MVMKKFDQNANFQNCDQGVEMLFSVTFRDIPKIDNHGSNSHLAPNVCFGNDTFFENPNIFPKNFHDFFELEFEAGWSMVGRSLECRFPSKSMQIVVF